MSKEYIERDLAIQSIKNEDDSHLDDYYRAGLFESEMVIKNLPAADVAPVVHGKWGLESDEDMPNPMFKLVVCSVCGEKANDTYNYCPNCGARMDGGKPND